MNTTKNFKMVLNSRFQVLGTIVRNHNKELTQSITENLQDTVHDAAWALLENKT